MDDICTLGASGHPPGGAKVTLYYACSQLLAWFGVCVATMEAKNKLHAVLVSVGFDEQKLRLDTVLEFLLAEEVFSLDDFEGAHNSHRSLKLWVCLPSVVQV